MSVNLTPIDPASVEIAMSDLERIEAIRKRLSEASEIVYFNEQNGNSNAEFAKHAPTDIVFLLKRDSEGIKVRNALRASLVKAGEDIKFLQALVTGLQLSLTQPQEAS